MKYDLTEGPLRKSIICFALPLLVSSLVQQLYNTVDLVFIGHFVGKTAFAAIGVSSLLISCLVGFFSGMSVGSTVVVSHYSGSSDHSKLVKTIDTAIVLSIAGGVILMLVGNLLTPHYLKLVNTPTDLLVDASQYLRIYFLSLVAVLIYNIGSGVLRALGNSITPLYAQILGGITNVLMNFIFIVWMRKGVSGAAWATLISQSCAAIFVLIKLYQRRSFELEGNLTFGYRSEIAGRIIRIGSMAGFQSLVITLSNVVVQYQINGFGQNQIAAFVAYFKIELLIYLPIVALGQAIMTFSGQNTGARKLDRLFKGTKEILLMGIVLIVALSWMMIGLGPHLFRVFTNDADVINQGMKIIQITFPFYFFYVILQVLGDSLRGMGKIKVPMLIVLVNICIVRTLLLFWIVPNHPNVKGVAMTYPITWALTALFMSIYYLREKRNIKSIESFEVNGGVQHVE